MYGLVRVFEPGLDRGTALIRLEMGSSHALGSIEHSDQGDQLIRNRAPSLTRWGWVFGYLRDLSVWAPGMALDRTSHILVCENTLCEQQWHVPALRECGELAVPEGQLVAHAQTDTPWVGRL
jgi:hypothetical protein